MRKIIIGPSLRACEQGVLFRCIPTFVSTTMVVVRSGSRNRLRMLSSVEGNSLLDGDGVGDWRAGRPLSGSGAGESTSSSAPSSSSLNAAIAIVLTHGDPAVCHLGVVVVFCCCRPYRADAKITDAKTFMLKKAITTQAASELKFSIEGS